MNKRDLFSKVSKILCLHVFSPHNVLCMYFLFFVLNQCKMLVADWGHRGSGSVKVRVSVS